MAAAKGKKRFSGYTFRRRLMWAGVAAAAIVAAALAVVLLPGNDPAPEVFSTTPAVTEKPDIKAPLTSDARHVAIRFVQTAVARKHLAEAWTLSGPNLRAGLTRKEFLTGNNAVVPYPLDELDIAPYKIDYSYTDRALLEVALLPKKGAGVKAQVFYLRLEKTGKGSAAHWVVNNWVPRAAAVTPR